MDVSQPLDAAAQAWREEPAEAAASGAAASSAEASSAPLAVSGDLPFGPAHNGQTQLRYECASVRVRAALWLARC